jgi:hypothetical protein
MKPRYICPVCGREMLGPDMLCSGSFLDRDHPSNVVPTTPEPPVPDDPPDGPPDMG